MESTICVCSWESIPATFNVYWINISVQLTHKIYMMDKNIWKIKYNILKHIETLMKFEFITLNLKKSIKPLTHP